MALSSMRMRDNLDYGVEGAAGKHPSADFSSGEKRVCADRSSIIGNDGHPYRYVS